jgi:hypothetical protein
MAVKITEKVTSGNTVLNSTDPTTTKIYNVWGTSSEADVISKVEEEAPTSHRGLLRASIECDPQDHNLWEVTVEYSLEESLRYVTDVSWSTTGKTQTRFRSLRTETSIDFDRNPWTNPPNFDGLINVSEDGPAGVDVVVPTLSFTETHKFNPVDVTEEKIAGWSNLTGTINNTAFRGFKKGEVLFKGVSGQTNADLVSLTFEFDVARTWYWNHNGSIKTIEGWNYMWFFNLPQMDLATGLTFQVPMAAYEEQVYYYGVWDNVIPERVGLPPNTNQPNANESEEDAEDAD